MIRAGGVTKAMPQVRPGQKERPTNPPHLCRPPRRRRRRPQRPSDRVRPRDPHKGRRISTNSGAISIASSVACLVVVVVRVVLGPAVAATGRVGVVFSLRI